MTLINRYAYLLVAAAAILAVWTWSEQLGTVWRIGSVGVTAVAGVLAWLALRPGVATVGTSAEFEHRRSAGRPMLVDFFSPF